MRVPRLSLRNFRVFPELDLEVPPGVVGIYGPNGAGKSTLVESILWSLFGVARTGKDSLRSDGATGETVATVEFEHDGHLYEVTRSLSGAANGVKAEAACDGQRVAAGAVAVRQYVHQVLGMSAEAFRSSVFCEQKQLDAFPGRRPEERRKLVLDLLGITPLDRARDTARPPARPAAVPGPRRGPRWSRSRRRGWCWAISRRWPPSRGSSRGASLPPPRPGWRP